MRENVKAKSLIAFIKNELFSRLHLELDVSVSNMKYVHGTIKPL